MLRSYSPRHAVLPRHLRTGKGQHRSPFWPTGRHRAPADPWPSIDALMGERGPGRTVAASMLCALSLAGLAQASTAGESRAQTVAATQVTFTLNDFVLPAGPDTPGGQAPANVPVPTPAPVRPTTSATAGSPTGTPKTTATAATAVTKPVPPQRVAGLSVQQTTNARTIVHVGQKMGLPKRALVIAIATALQESQLHNLANPVVAESRRYPHEGVGSDHDSVGLFQQRPSAGWGSVRNLMRPDYAATRFYKALSLVHGWQRMRVTQAAQAVQHSAYPNAYAKHEARATQIVTALLSSPS